MEGPMGSKLSPMEKSMYEKFVAKNPGMSEDDFLELRTMALKASSTGAKQFYSAGGVLMEESALPTGDEMKELREDNKAGE